jgi:hypothetical protein
MFCQALALGAKGAEQQTKSWMRWASAEAGDVEAGGATPLLEVVRGSSVSRVSSVNRVNNVTGFKDNKIHPMP